MTIAHSCLIDCHVFLSKNGIFLPTDVREKFSALDTLIWEGLNEWLTNKQHEIRPPAQEKQMKLRENSESLLNDLEKVVHQRLCNSQEPTEIVP